MLPNAEAIQVDPQKVIEGLVRRLAEEVHRNAVLECAVESLQEQLSGGSPIGT